MRNRSRVIVAAAAVALAFAAPPTAVQAQRLPAASPADPDALLAWTHDVAVWGQGFVKVGQSRGYRLGDIADGVVLLLDKTDAGVNPTAMTTWATPWLAEQRTGLGEDERALAQLGEQVPAAPRLPDLTAKDRAEVDDMLARLAGLPETYTLFLAGTRDVAERTLDLVEMAVGGDADALFALEVALADLGIEGIKAENVALRAAPSTPGGPAALFQRACLASNLGLLAWSVHQRNIVAGETVDIEGAASEIEKQGDDQRQAAVQLRRTADLSIAYPDMAAAEGWEVHSRLAGAVNTYAESADVEERMASVMDKLAEGVRLDDVSIQDQALAQITALIEQRAEIDTRRRAFLMDPDPEP